MAKDPYRYFRIEAQELVDGLSAGLLALERDEGPDALRLVLRHAHTFKGAARVVKQPEIADFAHRLEDILDPHRDEGRVPAAVIAEAFALVDAIGHVLATLDRPRPKSDQPIPAPAQGAAVDELALQSVRVHVSDLEQLLQVVQEAGAVVERVKREDVAQQRLVGSAQSLRKLLAAGATVDALAQSDHVASELQASASRLRRHADELAREIGTIQHVASELRLIPAAVLTRELDRAARDAATELSKEVELTTRGTDVRIDAEILQELRGALRHVVRNAVAHGIESPAEREAAGKPRHGTVEVSIERVGQRIAVRCRDDGRGLSVEALRRTAAARGLVPDENVDTQGLVDLLLRGGLSTAPNVDQIAGRGVGLDVVRDTANRLRGDVRIESDRGGTLVEVVVPVSLVSMPVLAVDVTDSVVFLPLDSVVAATLARTSERVQSGDGERLMHDGALLPVISLRAALGAAAGGDRAAVIVRSVGGLVAATVDRVRDVRSVIVQSLPRHVRASPVIAGAALDEEGVPRLVLAPDALADAASRPRPIEPTMPRARPLLVIDDSLTTRMLEQSILEAAGYEVDVAVSGEEALAMARRRAYGAFVVDVEMPGMSGFDFIVATQAIESLREIPSILVTSLDDAAYRVRGTEVGARAYIVKGQFDQRELLDIIRRLTEAS